MSARVCVRARVCVCVCVAWRQDRCGARPPQPGACACVWMCGYVCARVCVRARVFVCASLGVKIDCHEHIIHNANSARLRHLGPFWAHLLRWFCRVALKPHVCSRWAQKGRRCRCRAPLALCMMCVRDIDLVPACLNYVRGPTVSLSLCACARASPPPPMTVVWTPADPPPLPPSVIALSAVRSQTQAGIQSSGCGKNNSES
jgi:hypothetical protein